MSDVFQSAKNYRSRLKTELTKVDEFLRMAEEFAKESNPDDSLAFTETAADATPPEPPAIQLARRTSKEATAR